MAVDSKCLDMLSLAILALVYLPGGTALLFSEVQCPNPAQHCTQEMFNRVMENQGCLGCQTGCQSGFIMTANPRYYVDTDDPSGHYLYHNIAIASNVNVSEPQWLCLKGDACHSGYFPSSMGDMQSCSWCGDGCSKCTSFNNCERCFAGFSRNAHTLPGGQSVVTCSHSDG
ncbi:hypothetical protein BaRGS_00020295 [Batillaria attramentaria]|uniref:Uncharacterized protein n=1 Tax=Batillaria attramentaria TaxID=370345 RepID=A0ABD0KNA5_9CAEN